MYRQKEQERKREREREREGENSLAINRWQRPSAYTYFCRVTE